MKRPLLIAALIYVGGIIAAEYFPVSLNWLCWIFIALLSIALIFKFTRQIISFAAMFFVGWMNSALRTEIFSQFDLRTEIADRTELVTVRGTLCATPKQKIFVKDEDELWRSIAKLKTTAYSKNGEWHPAHGKILVTTPDILPERIFGGQTVEVTGVLQKPKHAFADGLFDYQNYLRHQGIFYQLTTASTNDWKLISALKNPPLTDRFLSWSKKTLAIGLPEGESLRLIWALALDWKTAFTDEAEEPFMRAGTYHVFAVDGLRIAIVSGILVFLLRALQIPRGYCGLIIVPLIWFYTCATGWPASAIRSAIMMTIVISGWALRRPSNLINSTLAAGLIILIWQPQQLFQAGFQLSFFVVLCIALLIPPVENFIKKLFRKNSMLPSELRPRWRQWLDDPIHFFSGILAGSCAAWFGSIPLSALYFHLFSTISIPANFIAVPLTMLILMSCMGSLVFGWCPPVAELFNNCSWLLMNGITHVSKWSANIPGGYFYVSTPAPITIVFYYILLLTVLTGWIFRTKQRHWIIFLNLFCASLWLLHWQSQRNSTQIHILPLAGGEAIFVDSSSRNNCLLIDCGNENSAAFVTKPFLRAHGINQLPKLILTHGDIKNMGGASNTISLFKIENVFTSPVKFRSHEYRLLDQWLRTLPELHHEIKHGDQFERWTVLHPEAGDKFSQADDGPIVLLGEIQGTKILFLSDLSQTGQNLLLQRTPNLKADIVVTGIPRGSEPVSDALLDALQPKTIVVTDTDIPASERASKKLRDRLAKQKVSVLYCREAGSVLLDFQSGGVKIKAANQLRTETLVQPIAEP